MPAHAEPHIPVGRLADRDRHVTRGLGIGPIAAELGASQRTVRRLLEEAGVPRMLGFAAPGAFSTWFRQQFGTTPSEWRSRARAPAGTGHRG